MSGGSSTALNTNFNSSELRSRSADLKSVDLPCYSAEELLVEKLDNFLRSVEVRLEGFERYIKFVANSGLEEQDDSDSRKDQLGVVRRSRSDSVASIQSLYSIRAHSLGQLQTMYNRLGMIKALVLRTSVANLDNMYAKLEEHYRYFMADEGRTYETPGTDQESYVSGLPLHKEVLQQRIINTLQYFDEKFKNIDNLIQEKTSAAKQEYPEETFRHFKYYNFNKALRNAETRDLHYFELPLNWRENRYIIQGYRFTLNHSGILKSMFRFNHNELANIWTHMIGLFMMLYIAFVHYPSTEVYRINSLRDNLVMYFFILAAIECFSLSVIWHTYLHFARWKTRQNCACIDYTGITVLISASIIAAEYASLYEYPRLLKVYVVFSTLCGLAGCLFNWLPYFDRPDSKPIRISFFLGLAFLGVLTIFCCCFYKGVYQLLLMFAPMVYKLFVWYWIGVVFYGGLIPERWRYDVVILEGYERQHSHTAAEIMAGEECHAGREELEEIEKECENEDTSYDEIIEEHFPAQPKATPYKNDFLLLWWVDYVFASHNIWHVCVVMGVLGHYVCVLDLFSQLSR